MRAGRLRHRVSIQRRTDVPNDFGEAVPTWSDVVTRYPAQVRDDSQREYVAQFQVQSEKTIHVTVRDPRREVTTKDRVVWHAPAGDRVLDIRSVLLGQNNGRDMVLICSEHSQET